MLPHPTLDKLQTLPPVSAVLASHSLHRTTFFSPAVRLRQRKPGGGEPNSSRFRTLTVEQQGTNQ
ncbi:MAG: hypothetical protein A2W79_20765 [Pseudomonadales bacterium RIFCSPLOWO2_12_60_38]|jgi:hypothetical protein|uniref:Uncharacterized protein n=1 Tax=Pseudomonas fluorescens TaxID=294 RepID=A0A379I7K7_PSEFL|nr:hypothetical protein H098_20060 [Pseudomonas fluorescens FH5]KSF53093.1 hypothetical protein AO931_21730 [Pseudomonas aeruginosa]OHC33016.1 MAG: hypothetical protein A2W79_20765 [Pseudomonadales bacterium RIFCSPLOWO2_12_60_38]OHC38993.1 MAG: hypothetical protein A3G72_25185 [Pseudomonadales bacterium RIFCSPLOWO2_12_FULL_59_450]SUD28467.1 Uncharacterised protein [Pseudomonas fluorescens]